MSEYIKKEDALRVIRDVLNQKTHLRPPIYDAITNVEKLKGVDIIRCEGCERAKWCAQVMEIFGKSYIVNYCSHGKEKE